MKRTILLVEDDLQSLCALKSILTSKGYSVLDVSAGEEALAVLETRKLDMILLDLQLPKVDGLAVLRQVRERPGLEDLPIVIMTACEPEKSRGDAITPGRIEFLSKPIDYNQLEAILNYLVPLAVVPNLT